MIAEADKTNLSDIVVVSDGDSGNQNDEQMKTFANEMPRLHMLKCIFRNIICADRGHILVHIQDTQDLSIHRCEFCEEIIVHDKTKTKKTG
jgi:hypothetical protein